MLDNARLAPPSLFMQITPEGADLCNIAHGDGSQPIESAKQKRAQSPYGATEL
jgi:hypothetical protein